MKSRTTAALLLLVPATLLAQVPVDDDGNAVGRYESQADIMSISQDGVPLLSYAELQELVGPVALYPDDLLAIVLPAAAYPLQIVEAARFLDALESDPGLTPDEDWDDSVVALVNYPEIIALLNEDLDWTLRLGEAVVAQQADVVAAVEAFRDRAYAAGNLQSDDYQTVSNDNGVINISPVADDVIYVPYYEPAKVVYYQPTPAYYYYPRPYPVYYYPYASNYSFSYGYFWGVSTAFTIGWMSDSLNVYHHSYYGHPYYGHSYWNHWYYRHPPINVYNTHYVNHGHGQNNGQGNDNHYSQGDHWQASETRRQYVRREGYSRDQYHNGDRGKNYSSEQGPRVPVTFRDRGTQQVSRDAQAQVRSTRNNANSNSTASAYNQSRDTTRQYVSGQSRETRRRDANIPVQSRSTQQRNTYVAETRNTQQRNATEAPVRNTQQRNTNAAYGRDTQARYTTVAPARDTRRQEAPRQTYQTPPAQTQRAPAPQQQRSSNSQPRSQPSTSSSPARSQERSSSQSSGASARSGSSSRQSRSSNRR